MLGGAHTAGIYADMTVDGPEIGTLVVIVDRAKNLPNRKTMGKQDPYCAARLGKEAKKTETDKRGGQTPKWYDPNVTSGHTRLMRDRDQEMRFTVHDSPDYYRLKVSVFNDDKKTEIIGETWVALDSIIVPGGGQNDIWHNLNCKGRYAGEIRIELTYYDIRPREVKTDERRQSSQVNGLVDPGREGVSGPRQPKPMKRRPLPADPTDSTRSSPLPYTSPANYPSPSGNQQRYVESPDDFAFEATPPLDSRVHRLHNVSSRGSPLNQNSYSRGRYSEDFDMPQVHQQVEPIDFDPHGVQSGFSQSPQNGHFGIQNTTYETEDDAVDYAPAHDGNFNNYPNSSTGSTVHNRPPKSLVQPFFQHKIHSNSSPALVELSPRHRSPVSKSNSYDEYPGHQRSHEDLDDGFYLNEQGAPPPPPPTHRHSGSTSSPRTNGRESLDKYPPIPAPIPLNLRNDRGSISGSPLSQAYSSAALTASTSPSDSQLGSYPAPSFSSRTSHTQPARRGSQSPTKDYDQPMPPSLVPGYEPIIAADESERILREQRMSAQQTHPEQSVPRYQQTAGYIQQTRAQPLSRNFDHVSERRAHRSSAPIINPRTVSPGPRTPMRKSVSPQPGSAPSERPQSELPFSPDSYDAFNPSLSASSSVNQSGARYNTPEQAKEATRQHERDVSLGDGPIIGSDGRIIDPSDHLPTATWAPEPEQKSPRKGPEVTLRFKHTPQAAQPLSPASRRPLAEARPNSISSPIYAHGADGISPAAATRARLQKKSRVAMSHPTSSPLVPTTNTSPRNAMPRSPASDYPLREHENYGYNSSPTYANRSPGGMPPPIPGKVPIGSGQEDWGMSALSEEMKRIDIGVGGGQRPRRSRYGT